MKIGDAVRVNRLGACEVVAIRPFGTVDVKTAKGNYYRVSGLQIEKESDEFSKGE